MSITPTAGSPDFSLLFSDIYLTVCPRSPQTTPITNVLFFFFSALAYEITICPFTSTRKPKNRFQLLLHHPHIEIQSNLFPSVSQSVLGASVFTAVAFIMYLLFQKLSRCSQFSSLTLSMIMVMAADP